MALVENQNDVLYKSLRDFYNTQANLDKMMTVISGTSRISLRMVDWFITNYSKLYYTLYDISDPRTGEMRRFKVHDQYKSILKGFKKKRFDIFCRKDRIEIPINDSISLKTTLAQLNCFRWIIENHVLDYIEANFQEIQADMKARDNSNKSKKNNEDCGVTQANKTRKKRQELSTSAVKSLRKEHAPVILRFIT
jgi:hypothetical protein